MKKKAIAIIKECADLQGIRVDQVTDTTNRGTLPLQARHRAIREMHASNLDADEIAEAIGCTRSTVVKVLGGKRGVRAEKPVVTEHRTREESMAMLYQAERESYTHPFWAPKLNRKMI